MGPSSAPTAPRFVPVEAKLRPPAQRDDLVQRGRVVGRLLDSADVPVVLVTAPPGFGKTVAVRQWDEADPRPFAWVSLDRDDDDPGVLLTYVTQALQRIGVVDPRIALHATPGSAGEAGTEAERLARLAAASARPFVLVLDESDALTSPVASEAVTRLTENVPPGVQVVLVGRAAPPLDWDRLRADERLLEVDAGELTLTEDEAVSLVDLAGADLPDDTVELLREKTEGWAAGLYLAVLGAGAQEVSGDGGAVGSDSVVGDYLRDEILLQLTPGDQAFLRRCSVLASLSAPLCDAVLETTGSAAALRRLARENIVLPDGSRRGWYRVYHLFAEALQAELARQEPGAVKPLHERASRWLERDDQLEEAIRHATAAGDVPAAARLVWHRVPACLASGRVDVVEQWLDAFTRRQVVAEAKLALSAAWCAIARGQPADHWLSAAERGGYDGSRAGEARSVAAATALMHALLARHGAVQMGADARLAFDLGENGDEWRATAQLLDAVAADAVEGTDEERFAALQQKVAAQGDALVEAAALAEQALARLASEDWQAVSRLVDRATALVQDHGLQDLSLVVLLPCLQALLAAHRGEPESAEAQARACSRSLALMVELPPWLGVRCRQVLARTQLLLGDAAAARTLLSEAQTLLRTDPGALALDQELGRVWRQVEQLPVDVAKGASLLTTAEVRVLQLLPTYLSFEEIGRQLFISRNTVKTQAIAAYRKLGVTSRAEAVDRARDLGLIAR